MSPQEEKEFVAGAFQKLKERGWFPDAEFEQSAITAQEIAAFEQEHQVQLPSLYKTFLTSFCLPHNTHNSYEICSVIEEDGELNPLWLQLDNPSSMADVAMHMEILQEIREFCELPEDCFRNLIPIGNWGFGWGHLCIDLSKSEDEIDEDDEDTWSLVWFDHEEFDWNEEYLGKDGMLHGDAALPSLKMLLELYFCGALEARFAQEDGIKPTYEWYQDSLNQ